MPSERDGSWPAPSHQLERAPTRGVSSLSLQAARRLHWRLHRLMPPVRGQQRIRTASQGRHLSQKLRPCPVTLSKVEDPRTGDNLFWETWACGSQLALWPLCCVAPQGHRRWDSRHSRVGGVRLPPSCSQQTFPAAFFVP